MGKISFKIGRSKTGRSKLRIALIASGCTVGVILIAAAVFFVVLYFQSQTEGSPTLAGTYAPQEQQEYVVQEYTEYFSGGSLQKVSVYDPTAEAVAGTYELYDYYGGKVSEFCGVWDGETAPETLRDELLAAFREAYHYSDNAMEKVEFCLYLPADSFRFTVTGAVIGEETASVTVQVIPAEGTAQEFVLSGPYQMEERWGTIEYEPSEVPEAIRACLQTFEYTASIDIEDVYHNIITFSELIALEQ